MGLKGKIEAIIYAAEEPVSLDHIALLVKEPALQELAEERALAEATQAAAEAEAQNGSTESLQPPTSDHIAVTENMSGVEADTPPTAAGEPEQASTSAEPEQAGEASAQIASESGETPATEQPLSSEAGANAEAPMAVAEVSPSAEATSDAAVQSDTLEPADHPLAEASEKARSNAASKRKAKAEISPEVRAKVRATLEELVADYTNPDRGMEIRQIAGGFRMTTKPEHHDVVKAFAKSLKPPLRLSLPALETLAVIAYKQPVTAPEVSEIRGVDSQGVIATLLDRKLITTAGRKAVIGRPILYKTTKEFLMRFGLNEISELPSMEEFEKLALEAGQVDMFNSGEENVAAAPPEASEAAASDEETVESGGTEQEAAKPAIADSKPPAEQDVAREPAAAQVEAEPQPQETTGPGESEPAESEEPVH